MSVQPKTKAGSTQWSTHDPACNHCRTRKIKCGREHPQCANCKRDGAQCDFSDQGKRINHIKLLVDNFGGLEGRLVSIEKELVRLTDSIARGTEKQHNHTYSILESGFPTPKHSEREWAGSHEPADFSEEDKKPKRKRKSLQQPGDGYGISDRHHEPCTLLALCNELRDLNLRSSRSSPSPLSATTSASASASATQSATVPPQADRASVSRKEAANSLLAALCSTVSTEELFDLGHESETSPVILLPPKQFLVMACTPFFQQEDPAIDLFCQSTFWANVDRIYNKPFTSADEAWALCFNNIILLVLGAGQPGFGSEAVMGSQFVMPFLSTMRRALAYPKMLMAPELINVQALALLSVTAQQYMQSSFTEATLERACQLAKQMGLHQQRFSGLQTPSEEDEERLKVFRSLFLRDKTFSISRGINCRLPSLDCSISFSLGKSLPIDTVMFARLQLARLQEEIYRALYSSESFPLSTSQRRAAICRIEEGLRQWAAAYEDPKSAEVVQAIDVQLDFRASRIVALRSSSDPRHMEQVVRDARASSMLLSNAVGRVQTNAPPTPDTSPASLMFGGSSSLSHNASEHASLRVRSLVESFSVPACFALVQNIIWPKVEDRDGCDVEYLRTISQIFQDLDQRMQANTYTRKVSHTFQSLLQLVQVLRPAIFEHMQRFENQDQQQHYFDFPHQVSLSTSPIPVTSTNFSNSSSAMSWLPLNFPSAGQFAHSTSHTTTTNLTAFDFPDPYEYDGRICQYDPSQSTAFSSHGNYENKPGYVTPNTLNKDYHHQAFYPQFAPVGPMIPLDGEQHQTDNNSF